MTFFEQIQYNFLNAPVATFIFLVTLVTSILAFSDTLLMQKFMLRPYSFVENKKYYTIITSGLIHANWMHLGMNMLTFWFFAFGLDDLFVMLEAWKHTGEPSEIQ
ncbi:MAG TPA: rhomboid family intramembrane serine protease, partial [Bacteroidetes bacterium]|nr:rhomboid family intramembrane serine protease [Bacteroidota bacterium]